MKKICVLVLLCLPFILKAQDAVVFKVKYQPNSNYKMRGTIDMKMNLNVTGDPEVLQKLKDEGITQPATVLLGLGPDINVKTGAVASDNTIPLIMDLKIDSLNVMANGKQVPIPPMISEKKVHIIGHTGADNTWMTIDSVNGKAAADSAKKAMGQMMSMMQQQIRFPTKPMKPGDTFTQTIPVNVPVKGKDGNLKIDAGVTYKLNNIADGKAYFDVLPKFTMNIALKKVAVTLTGIGAGKMVYSIKDNFPVSSTGTFNMTIRLTSEKANVDGTAVVNASSTTVIN
ncbi:MAG: hypothetical protein JSU01_15050 [Bacteroidetes bacterium]|nr:hypothetical protein [Bacteroidota bacterium]